MTRSWPTQAQDGSEGVSVCSIEMAKNITQVQTRFAYLLLFALALHTPRETPCKGLCRYRWGACAHTTRYCCSETSSHAQRSALHLYERSGMWWSCTSMRYW